jgi:hypothetical protein
MSDHLARLAARALGLADTVRPRRTSFEPQRLVPEPGSSADQETERTPAPMSPPVEVAETRHSDVAVVKPEIAEDPAPRARAEEQVAEQPPEIAGPPGRPPEPVPSAPDRTPEQARKPEQAAARREPEPEQKHKPPVRSRSAARPEPPAPGAAPRLVVTRRAPLLTTWRPDRSPAAEPEAEQPPTVRVMIGRVDVRAVVPEEPVERRPKQPPRMSLDEYLSRNRSGAR